MTELFSRNISKTEAVRRLAKAYALEGVDPYGITVGNTLEDILKTTGSLNLFSKGINWASGYEPLERQIFASSKRRLESPIHLSERPDCFPFAGVENAFSPGLSLLSIPHGMFWNFAESPVIFMGDGRSIVREYSSRYSSLIHFYDEDHFAVARDCSYIDGSALVMTDDIRPLNFCHWLIDWLPRLAALEARARRHDTYIITTPITAKFQLETLEMCGFERNRIIEVKNFQAIRAKELLVTSDLREMPHPAFKAAPWATSYLRSTIGLNSLVKIRKTSDNYPKKIYISRSDASGRHNLSEENLCTTLSKNGYTKIVLSEFRLADQVALFAGATHVVGIHGAGLSHVVFFADRAQVIEIFPSSYGTPAYYVLTAGLGNSYASFVVSDVVRGPHAQADSFRVNVIDFLEKCGLLL